MKEKEKNEEKKGKSESARKEKRKVKRRNKKNKKDKRWLIKIGHLPRHVADILNDLGWTSL